MKKKNVIVVCCCSIVLVIVIAATVIFMQNQTRKPDDDTLVFEGDNKKQIIVDIAIQEKQIIYMGSILLKDSTPTLKDVVDTINNSNEGIVISVENGGIIKAVNDCKNKDGHEWRIYINNEKVNEDNIDKIEVKQNDGITLMY